ncbi:GGDEF domain-containing protein [Enterovibrio calviensis]|uniref:GGDEF domain-containing protein n=1 Tax=Enterovibrio calviensis TaxID=91359 RepID=UPI0004891DA3|nr:GGDEF domain-containing protein [Enterovibrio calviensis]
MLSLDNRTLLTVTALISIGSAVALFSLWRSQSKSNGAGFWAIGMSSVALASVLISLRDMLPDLLSLVAANSLYILGFQLILRGIRIFVGRPPLALLDYALVPTSAVLLYYFNFIDQNLNMRVAVVSMAFVIICSNVVITFLQEKHAPWRSAGFAVALMFGLFGFIHGVRGVIMLMSPLEHHFMAVNITASLVFLGGIFMIAGMAITLILLTYAVLESEFRIVSLAVEQSASSIIITDKAGVIHYVNPAFTETTGYLAEELIGKKPNILKPNETGTDEFSALWDSISSGKVWRGEFYNRKKSGELFWEIASIAPVKQRNGEISHFVAVKEDITALKEARKQIDHLAYHDTLTGLPNRKLSMDRLCNAVTQAKMHKCKVAVLFIDLDGFKVINDTLGHDAGDMLLKATAQKLCECVRDIDTVARIGGDEFLVTLCNIDSTETIRKITERMIESVSTPTTFGDTEITITASIGISLYPAHGTTPDELVTLADQAMYKIKHQGKNAYLFADQPCSV